MNKQKTKITLSISHPELTLQWHPTKNGELTPNEITAGGNTKYWWLCSTDIAHEWQATCSDRTGKNKSKCPFCSGRRVHITNCLATLYPALATQWHPTKNGKKSPYDVTRGSAYSAWWICPINSAHEWQAAVGNRTIQGQNCPFCDNKKVSLESSLSFLYPDIAKEWDIVKNEPLSPINITPGSGKKVWWLCLKNVSHEWQATCKDRTKKTSKCPFCTGKKPTLETSLALTYPHLVPEWHPQKNKLSPREIVPGSTKRIWWQCLNDPDHEWQTRCVDRAKNEYGCPFCSGHKVLPKNSLAITHPDITKEWHPIKNESLKATEVSAGSNKKVWWLCIKDPIHEWQAACCDRTGNGTGCPLCNSGWTIDKIRLFLRGLDSHLLTMTIMELHVIMQQANGLLDCAGKGKLIVQAILKDKIPLQELQKFANAQPSLVDELIDETSDMESQEEKLNRLQKAFNDMGLNADRNDNHRSNACTTIHETLSLLNNPHILAGCDIEAIEYLIKSAIDKIWRCAFANEENATQALEQYHSEGLYDKSAKDTFLCDYQKTKELIIPKGYSFKHPPRLMQKLLACLVRDRKKIANWSGPGAGKTLAAILASRVINARITVVCCPNNVIGTWLKDFRQIYPDSTVLIKELNLKKYSSAKNLYVILNYEFFQQRNASSKLQAFLQDHVIDFIIIDEVHYAKQRDESTPSKRKDTIDAFRYEAGQKNENIHILAMTGTPVINNITEGKKLIELLTGEEHNDLSTRKTFSNNIKLHQKLVIHGIRDKTLVTTPDGEACVLNHITEEIDATSLLSRIAPIVLDEKGRRRVGQYSAELDEVLTEAKLPFILNNLEEKTIIYNQYHNKGKVLELLRRAIEQRGLRVCIYSESDKSGLQTFKNGDADVLIASSCISTGIDGLQEVCNTLIINSLPWTYAILEQLQARVYRPGQKKSFVNVIFPLTFFNMNGNRFSYCEARLNIIKSKRKMADMIVDGIIPEEDHIAAMQAQEYLTTWIQQLDRGDLKTIERRKIIIPLVNDIAISNKRKLGTLTLMNQRINSSSSTQTHERFFKNPAEWESYHAAYREERHEWPIVPYQEAIIWLKKRPSWIIGDFGCGEAFLAKELQNQVYSFDHIAISDQVVACDMKRVPIADSLLDAAVFSLSLMGTNSIDYIREAHRCLKLDGHLWIAEPTSRIPHDAFKLLLHRLGFNVMSMEQKWKFTFVHALKSERDINETALKTFDYTNVLN